MPPNHSWNSPWFEGFRLIYLKRDEVPEVQKEHVVIIGNSSTSFGLPVPFRATVDVWIELCNAAGLCSRRSNKCRILPLATIHAPEEVSVTDITDTGFKVSFRKGKLWVIEDFGDHYSTKLKLAVIGNSARQIVKYDKLSLKGHILVEDLTPWTLYSICLQVRIVSVVYHESTAFSPSKCSVVRTKQARPSVPPTITSCNSNVSSNSSMVFKEISWSMPPSHSWNSPWLEGFRLIYLRRYEVPEVQKEHVVIIGNSSTSFGLPVPFRATVDVWIELCNAAGLCSRRSNKCRILPLAKTADKPDIRRWTNDDVSSWLNSIGLSSVSNKTREWLDGKMLIRLQNLRRESPEFFYSSIKDELDLKHLPQVLTFADELEKLTG